VKWVGLEWLLHDGQPLGGRCPLAGHVVTMEGCGELE
jgi:hypothetical protein